MIMYATCVPLPLPLLPPLALLTLGQELVHYEVLVALVHVELLHAMCQAVVSARLRGGGALVHVELLHAMCQAVVSARLRGGGPWCTWSCCMPCARQW